MIAQEKEKAKPIYYRESIVPQMLEPTKNRSEMRDAYLKTLTNKYTPVKVLIDTFMKPIPPEIGQLQCDIERNTSGLNKFWPKYVLTLTDSKKELLTSKKLANSKTSHYRIDLADDGQYRKPEEESQSYIGRLRATFSNHEFYIYDTGLKQGEMKPGAEGVGRRQYGTVIYAPDKFGTRNPRKLEVYLPLIEGKMPTKYLSWPDTDQRKQNIYFEYT